jgi:hypothetical protein
MMVNFVIANCSYLKYFIPLVRELGSRDVKSTLFLMDSPRYNSPYKCIESIKKLSSEYNFGIEDVSKISGAKTVSFLVEGAAAQRIRGLKISLTALSDFQLLYQKYIKEVHYVIFPSEFFASYYKAVSSKNVYLGSPKYDVELDKEYILKKYKLKNSKNVLVVFPRTRDLSKIDMLKIYGFLKGMGYNIIVKSRAKDVVAFGLRGDKYYEDLTWYPHTTMELIEVSDIVINFGSTAIKECVMLNTPVINFNIKPTTFEQPLLFLYNYGYCANFSPAVSKDRFVEAAENLINGDMEAHFKDARKNHLFENKNVSKSIIDFVMEIK